MVTALKKDLAKKRIIPTIMGLFICLLIIASCVLVIIYIDILFVEQSLLKDKVYYGTFIVIFFTTVTLFMLIDNLLKDKTIIRYDDNYLYIDKSASKTIQIAYKEIKRVKAKKVNNKTREKHGNIIIKTKKKKYKVKGLRQAKEVEAQIKFLVKNQSK